MDGYEPAVAVVAVPGIGAIRIELDAEGKPVDHAERLHALGNAVYSYGAAYAYTVLWARLAGE